MSGPDGDHSAVPAHAEYAMGADEALPAALQRIIVDQFDRIIRALVVRDEGLDEGVHTARKTMKRVRGLLLLVQHEIDTASYRRERRVLRDCGRVLAPVRDTFVLITTLDSVGVEIDRDSLRPIRTALQADHVQRSSTIIDDQGLMASVVADLTEARNRFAGGSPLQPAGGGSLHDGFATIQRGLSRAYRRGRADWKVAQGAPTDEELHDWRKWAKYLRHQLEMLVALSPDDITPDVATLTDLGEDLGADHDLAVLTAVLAGDDFRQDPAVLEELRAAIDRRRAPLLQASLDAGEAFYSPKTRHFIERIEGLWQAVRVE